MTDVVCVLNSALQQVFAAARPMKATVKREAKAMEHPLETGATITDHRIIQPTEIELSMVIASADYRATYQQIAALFASGELLTVQTRADTFKSMSVCSMPHEESPDSVDALAVALSLKEVRFVSPSFASIRVRHAKDSRTKGRGEQQPQATTKPAGSILSGLFKHG